MTFAYSSLCLPLYYYPAISCFFVHVFGPLWLHIIVQGCGASRYPGFANAVRPTRLRPGMPIHRGNDATPSGLLRASGKPRVAASRQPWAMVCSPFEAKKGTVRLRFSALGIGVHYIVLGKNTRSPKDAEYNSAIVRPRGRFISGVKVPDRRSMP